MATAIPTLPNSSGRALVLGSIGLSCCLSLGAQRHIARNHQQTAFRHDGLGVVVLLKPPPETGMMQLFIGQIDLIGWQRPFHRRLMRLAAGLLAGGLGLRRARRLASWRWRPAVRPITGRARLQSLATMRGWFRQPYVKRGNTDRIDAEAICEAERRPAMRFVPVKTIEQRSLATLHRSRKLWSRPGPVW